MKTRVLALLGAALAASPALASDQPGAAGDQWKEEASATINNYHTGDAGQFPSDANLTRGAGPLNRITGSLQHTPDVDMFCINITDPQSFSATVLGGFGQDPYLALFTVNGVGVAFNDNTPDGNPTPGTINGSKLTSQFVTAPGLYFLAIGRSDGSKYFRPVGASGLMFPGPAQGDAVGGAGTERNLEFAPTTPGDTLTGYEAPALGFDIFNFGYTITLTGTSYHQAPSPAGAALLGMGGLMAARRRRR